MRRLEAILSWCWVVAAFAGFMIQFEPLFGPLLNLAGLR